LCACVRAYEEKDQISGALRITVREGSTHARAVAADQGAQRERRTRELAVGCANTGREEAGRYKLVAGTVQEKSIEYESMCHHAVRCRQWDVDVSPCSQVQAVGRDTRIILQLATRHRFAEEDEIEQVVVRIGMGVCGHGDASEHSGVVKNGE